MDLKERLDRLVSEEKQRIAAEDHRKKSFEGQQQRAFKEIKDSLEEIVQAAGPIVTRFYIGDWRAELRIQRTSSSTTTYEIEPNSVGKFSSEPSPAKGFEVRSETTYDNGIEYIEPSVSQKVFPSSDAVLELLMKEIAEAIAWKEREGGR